MTRINTTAEAMTAAVTTLEALLGEIQFDGRRPSFILRPVPVGYGGQVSLRIFGLKVALATGRRCVFGSCDDFPYVQSFQRMSALSEKSLEGNQSTLAFSLLEILDTPSSIAVQFDLIKLLEKNADEWNNIKNGIDNSVLDILKGKVFGRHALDGLILRWMRLTDEMDEHVASHMERLGIGRDVLGVHLRRGDKNVETAYLPTSAVNREISRLCSTSNFSAIYLASDDPDAYKKIIVPNGMNLIFDRTEKRYNNANHKMIDKDPQLRKTETFTAVKNLYLLGACGGIVGQDNAHFATLAAGLQLSGGVSNANISLLSGNFLESGNIWIRKRYEIRRFVRKNLRLLALFLGLVQRRAP